MGETTRAAVTLSIMEHDTEGDVAEGEWPEPVLPVRVNGILYCSCGKEHK